MTIQQATPTQAHALLAQGYQYLDVRTPEEFAAGHPTGAVNLAVASPTPSTGQMAINPEFVSQVEQQFPHDTKLVVGCQSGMRSQRAAELLTAAGFSTVVNMQGGFGGARDAAGHIITPGWRDSGLPVTTGGSTGG